MQTHAPFWDSLVFEGIDNVEVEAARAAFGTVEVVAGGRAAGSASPDCGCFSGWVHDRYQRRLKDLSLAEQGFVIRLTVRRFICGSVDCPLRTFVKPFPRLTAPHARFTTRLNHAPGASGARAGPAGWLQAGRPVGLRRGTADLVTQGHGTTRSAVQNAASAGCGRLRDPPRPDLFNRLDQRRRPPRGRLRPGLRSHGRGHHGT
ncbi:transposase family protein [Streptomyces sp. NPDC005786]|uniref:transposase family protein n=1 Tax=Streptomyces sp. NPDC005786 TaxID=3154891 RepID=UPI0033F899C7